MNAHRIALIVAIGVAPGIAGCERQQALPEADAATAQAAGAAEPFGISEISVSDGSGDSPEPTNVDDPIVVIVRSTGRTQGADLEIKLFALANGAVAASRTLRLDGTSGAEQSVAFENAEPWEPGRYLVEVTLDGKLAGHRELDVVAGDPAAEQESAGQ